MGYLYYNIVDKEQQSQYPDWANGSPNLFTFLTALNLSQPIIGAQFELVMSRWPRTIFFAKNIRIPGISVNTIDINHAGFTIPISTHAKYDSQEISFTVIADKEGFHYYDLRNYVIQSGHPLVAGDTMSTIGQGLDDKLEIRLRNKQDDDTHHHWIIHNWRPIKIGEIELSHDSTSFVEFELTGTFTHILYDSGVVYPPPMDNSFGELPSDENDNKLNNNSLNDGFGVLPPDENDNKLSFPEQSDQQESEQETKNNNSQIQKRTTLPQRFFVSTKKQKSKIQENESEHSTRPEVNVIENIENPNHRRRSIFN